MKSPIDMWDHRYGDDPAAYGDEPNRFLAGLGGMLPKSGRALLPGDGQGRNGIWLAENGLQPLCIDLSSVGLQQATERSKKRGVDIDTIAGDFLEADFPPKSFPIVASIYFHVPSAIRPAAHSRMAEALAPGGLLIVEAFAVGHLPLQEKHHSGGPATNDMLYSEEILRRDFADLDCLYLEEIELVLAEGKLHNGLARVVRGLFSTPSRS
ncbi:MAG: class I SAM-dependent methyltransferase [Pseudomonadota bacterium]